MRPFVTNRAGGDQLRHLHCTPAAADSNRAAAADWPRHLGKLFAKEGADALKASKAIKKTVKAAAKRSGQPTDSLRAELQAFLDG